MHKIQIIGFSLKIGRTGSSWSSAVTIYGMYLLLSGPGSSVGIATELRAGRPGIESRWGRDFPPVQTGSRARPPAHPASCKMGTGSFMGVKCGRGVLLTTHPLLVPRSWKSRAIPLGHNGPVTGSLYLLLASKPFDYAWFEVLETIPLYCTW